MVITIDGYCSQGKSFTAKELARQLKMEYFSTGKLVRYVAYLYSILLLDDKDSNSAIYNAVEQMKNTDILQIDGCEQLKTAATETAMKTVAECPYVFEQVIDVIKNFAGSRDIVLDGRFTFNIIPNAERSYYFMSSRERRIALTMKSKQCSYEKAAEYIAFRDSFEKKYDLPEKVKVVMLDEFNSAESLVQYLMNDVRNEG